MSKNFLGKKVFIGEQEIGFLYINKIFKKALKQGKHYLPLFKRYDLKIISSADRLLQRNDRILYLANKYKNEFIQILHILKTDKLQIALVYTDGILTDLLPPASTAFLWKNSYNYKIQYLEIEDASFIDESLLLEINLTIIPNFYSEHRNLIVSSTIKPNHIGLLFKDNKFIQILPAGKYAWWTINSTVEIIQIDTRLQNMEITGQDILTKDMVGIRLNVLASWKINNAEKLIKSIKDYEDFLYREIQLALRTIVATKNLDELLSDKNLLNSQAKELVQASIKDYGLDLKNLGVKDIILPGDMKDILSKVVKAEKIAEANLIKRRKETQATHSLHNTAKVMENNPILLRLKELESLEKITSKINNLSIYAGLDALLNDLVKIKNR